MRRSEFLQRSAAVAALIVLGYHPKHRSSGYGVAIYGLAFYGGRHKKLGGGSHERSV